MLTKHNVCLFIKDEEHLEEMRDFLIGKDKNVSIRYFYLSNTVRFNYLQFWKSDYNFIIDKNDNDLTEVSTEQFKKLWE